MGFHKLYKPYEPYKLYGLKKGAIAPFYYFTVAM